MNRKYSLYIFGIATVIGKTAVYYVSDDVHPVLLGIIVCISAVSPFAFLGAALARIGKKTALTLIGIGTVALIVGIIIVRMEPEGILTVAIPVGGLGFILGALAHLILDRPRPSTDRNIRR